MDPVTIAALVSAGSKLIDLFGSGSDDAALDAIRTASAGNHVGSQQTRQTLNDYYGRATALNAPGNDAYGEAMETLDSLLNKGYVQSGNSAKWDDAIKRTDDKIASLKQGIGNKNSIRGNVDANWQSGIDAANTRATAEIRRLQGVRKELVGKRATASKGGKGKLSVEQWLKKVDPGYRFRYDEGMKAVAGRQSSRKDRLSGRAMKELARYGQGFATDEFGKSVDRLFKQAGLGENAIGRTTNAALGQGTDIARTYAQDASQYGDSLIAAGNIKSGTEAEKQDAWGGAGGTLIDRYRRSLGTGP